MKGCYYTINLNEDCNNCFACVGMCPSGALKISRDDADTVSSLSFNTSLCNGCGLCRDFCFNNALNMKQGFSGANPFDFIPLNRGIKGL
jgi:ferredoxin